VKTAALPATRPATLRRSVAPRRSASCCACVPASAITLRCPCFAKDQPRHPWPGVRCMQLTRALAFVAVRLTPAPQAYQPARPGAGVRRVRLTHASLRTGRHRYAAPLRCASLLRLCTGLGINASAFAACNSPVCRRSLHAAHPGPRPSGPPLAVQESFPRFLSRDRCSRPESGCPSEGIS
jgi:hypothetical protein